MQSFTFRLKAQAKCKLIFLKEAEDLLAHGYVFGGHTCPYCMAAQEKVSFDQYDLVRLCCFSSGAYSEPTKLIPFYEFCKEIGAAKNGNIAYAMTYVCAVEVSGLEEYYENQQSNHRYFPSDVVDD